MPVFRTPDGKIVEEKTKPAGGSDANLDANMGTDNLGLTEKDRQGSSAAGSNDFYDKKTYRISDKTPEIPARQPAEIADGAHRRPPEIPARQPAEIADGAHRRPPEIPARQPVDDARTHLFIGHRGKTEKADVKPDILDADDRSDGMQDPVVGWLAVVDGPGRGNVLTLSYGTNSIGRSEQNRVPLAFGDDQISRSKHAVVTFDPLGKKFYVQHGGGTNLTYLDGSPVLQPAGLKDRSDISMGNTTLKLIALCGDDFDWRNE